jgi:DNA-binding transcriptional regulator YdaS (Cro superfamily)
MSCVEKPLEAAVRIAGSQAELARRCGTSQPRIWQCLYRNRTIPADLVLPIERATGVSRQRLRPDLFPVAESSLSLEQTIQPCLAPLQSLNTAVQASSSRANLKLDPLEARS